MRDVIAVNLKTHIVRILAEYLDAVEAEGTVELEARRHPRELVVAVVNGRYQDGDLYRERQ